MAVTKPCKDCLTGFVNDGVARGKEIKLHGLNAYATESPSGQTPNAVIVFVHDLFGWKFNNTRVLADSFAEKGGYQVYVPDFMDGLAAPVETMTYMDQLTKPAAGLGDQLKKPLAIVRVVGNLGPAMYQNRAAVCHPRVVAFFTALRASQPTDTLPVGVVGFCWGGLHAVQLTHPNHTTPEGKGLVDVAFTAHPSGLSLPADIEKVGRPLSVAIGSEDMVLSMTGVKQLEKILSAKREALQSEVVVYEGAKHGKLPQPGTHQRFAVRPRPGNESEEKQAAEAEEQALAWFKKHLPQVPS